MDISNLTMTGSAAPTPGKVTGAAASNIPANPGNKLPELGQGRVRSDNPPDTKPTPRPNTEELHNLVNKANEAMQAHSSNLKFSVDKDTDINVVRIEDVETGEVIRQFPSDEMLAIARALKEVKQGTMLEDKA